MFSDSIGRNNELLKLLHEVKKDLTHICHVFVSSNAKTN